MSIKQVVAASFSPTGNTSYVVNLIAQRISNKLQLSYLEDNFTLPNTRQTTREYEEDTLLVIGLPTYAGRIPNKILPFVQEHLKGNRTLSLPIVTFGNRSFDEALKELCLELESHGFNILAGAGIVTEHVFSNKLAAGRPNADDILEIYQFADSCIKKILSSPIVPLDFYKKEPLGGYYKPLGIDGKPTVFLKAKPMTHKDRCIKCNLCVNHCPMGSIDPLDSTHIPGICIKCHACIKICPQNAKYFADEAFLSHKSMLETNYERRTESVYFI